MQTIKFIASSILLMIAFQTQASSGLSDIKIKNGIYYQYFTDIKGDRYYQCFTGGPIANPYINKTKNWFNTDKYLTGCLKAIEANK
ncbi:hypothetical protein AB6C47_018255 [Vibrio cyclitrophicus]